MSVIHWSKLVLSPNAYSGQKRQQYANPRLGSAVGCCIMEEKNELES